MKESIRLSGKQMAFRQRRTSNSIFLLVLLMLIVPSLFLWRATFITGEIKSPFLATATPTRSVQSFAAEGKTHFNAGDLPAAITAYQKAVQSEPNNSQIWSELARIQAYSSATLSTDDDRRQRMQDALRSIDTAIKVAPDDPTAHAIRAFVLDWNSPIALSGSDEKSQEYLTQAEQEAARALTLDSKSTLALAYNAEIMVDEQRWIQAEQAIAMALQYDDKLMDVHRVRAYVQESLGNYAEAISEYKKAVEINPNLTFLHISIGVNYRQLRQYQVALDWFDQAVQINKQLLLNDPIPYLAIGKTYSQLGQFPYAGRNVKIALKYNPTNPEVYGSLGLIYFKSRNYEDAIDALKCAVRGCDAAASCKIREISEADCKASPEEIVQGMPLTSSTVVYYYTYGSDLAALHTKANPDYCPQAVQILKEVRQAFANDKSILSIIEPSEQICLRYGIQ
jgi:tetratricopeptide (TPR) repeat protein